MDKTVGLYVHIPFCIKKCRYCDFVSYTNCEKSYKKYIEALQKEASLYKGTKVDTIFIGGGTPTILSCDELELLLKTINENFEILENAEFTVESNPKTITKEKAKILKKYGVTRISVGVQSFCDDELNNIGRVHTSEEAKTAISELKESGEFLLNLDVMLSLPNQTIDSLEHTLNEAVKLNPDHISAYSLIVEEGTPIYDDYEKGIYKYPDDDIDRELYKFTVDFLKNNGYERYEISNFAKNNNKCKHNLKYWNCDEYLGLGVSAHSYYNGKRFSNTSSLEEYINGNYKNDDETTLSQEDKIKEYIIMRLRLVDGIDLQVFYDKFLIDFQEKYKNIIENMVNAGLMEKVDNSYRLTNRGIDISNSVLCEFV